MAQVTEVVARLRTDARNYVSGMGAATAATNQFATATNSADVAGKGLFSTSNLLKGAIAAVGTTMLVKGVSGAFKLAGEYEQTRIALTALYGSAEAAEYRFAEFADFAAKTPFELPDLLTASKRLLVIGYEADRIIPIMTQLGNAAGALGVSGQNLNAVVYALGQMKGLGRVITQDMRQIANALPGFNPFLALADSMGITQGEVQKLIEKGLVPADEAIEMILKGLEKIPGAAGAMERQSKTLLGLMSTLKDNIGIAVDQAIRPFLPQITGVLTKVIDAVGPLFLTLAGSLGKGVAMIQSAFGPLMQGFRNLYVAFQPIIQGIGQAFVFAVGLAFKYLSALTTVFQRITGFIRDNATAFQSAAAGALAFYTVIQASKLGSAISGMMYSIQVLTRFIRIYRGELIKTLIAQAALAAPIYLAIGAIAALVTAFVYAYNTSETFRQGVGQAFNSIAATVGKAISFVLTGLGNLLKGFASMIRTNANVRKAFESAFIAVANIVTVVVTALLTAFANVIKGVASVVFVIEQLKPIFQAAFKALAVVVGAFVFIAFELFKTLAKGLDKLMGFIGDSIIMLLGAAERAARLLGPVGRGFADAITTMKNAVVGGSRIIRNALTTMATVSIDQVGKFIDSAVDALPKVNQAMIDNARGWGNYSSGVAGALSNAANSILDFAQRAQALPDLARRIAPDISEGLANAAETAANFLFRISGSIMDFTTADPFGRLADGMSGVLDRIKAALGLGKDVAEAIDVNDYVPPVAAVDPVAKAAEESAEAAARAAKMVENIKDAVKSGVDSVVELIKTMKEAAVEYANSLRDTIKEFGGIKGIDLPENFIPQAKSLIENMKMRLNRAREFGKQVEELQRLGLNTQTLQDIISAGPTQGFQFAASLIQGGQEAIRQINDVQAALTGVGTQLGTFAAGVVYGPALEDASIALAGLLGQTDVRRTANNVYVSQGAFTVNIDVSDAANIDEVEEMVLSKIQDQFERLLKELSVV